MLYRQFVSTVPRKLCLLPAPGVHTYIEDLSYTYKSDDASEVERCVTNGNKRRTTCPVQPDLSYHYEEVLCSHSHGHHPQSVGHHWKLPSVASGHFLCSSLTESGSVPASGTEVAMIHTPSSPCTHPAPHAPSQHPMHPVSTPCTQSAPHAPSQHPMHTPMHTPTLFIAHVSKKFKCSSH